MNSRSRNAAIGISIPQLNLMNGKRLTDNMSVITEELVAILLALEWVEENGPGRKSEARSDLIVELLVTLDRVNKMGNIVGFLWVLREMKRQMKWQERL